MSYIEVVQPDGTAYATLFKAGSKEERQFCRVMTERWGKLFFDSRETYDRWCSSGGRANSERRGHFPSSRRHTAQPTQVNEDGQEEFVIIEEYVVEENGEVVPE